MTNRQIIADFLLDFAALLVFGFLIYAGKLTPGEGLPPLLLILGIKTANRLKGGPRNGGIATVLAILTAGSVAAAVPSSAAPDADAPGEHTADGADSSGK